MILLTNPDINRIPRQGEESVVNGERPCDFWFSVAKSGQSVWLRLA